MSTAFDYTNPPPAEVISQTILTPNYKSTSVSTQGLGAASDVFSFGFYEWAAADANLDEGNLTQTFVAANISMAAHAFAVFSGAGSVNAGQVGLRVNGVSITDQGVRTAGDTETLTDDITSVAANQYLETDKKWLGTITYQLFTVSGTPATFSVDFNYGVDKYDDWGNNDFQLTDVECVGFAGANDANFNIILLHHRSTGWTYSAAAFNPISAANTIASLVGDHGADDQLALNTHFAWKRDNLTTDINGADSEGFLIFIDTSSNNAIEYLNMHIGAIPQT